MIWQPQERSSCASSLSTSPVLKNKLRRLLVLRMRTVMSALVLLASLHFGGSTRIVGDVASLQEFASFTELATASANDVNWRNPPAIQEGGAAWTRSEWTVHASKVPPFRCCCQGACERPTDIDPFMTQFAEHPDRWAGTAQLMRSPLPFRYQEPSYELDRPPI